MGLERAGQHNVVWASASPLRIHKTNTASIGNPLGGDWWVAMCKSTVMSTEDEWPKIFSFALADHFDPATAKDKFVLAMAAIANDLLLVHRLWLGDGDERSGVELTKEESVYMLRLAMAQVWESYLLILAARAEHTSVARFLASLPGPGQLALDRYDEFRELIESNRNYRAVLVSCRNLTSHYPGPDDKNFVNAIGELGSTEQTPTARDGTVSGIRATFADAVLFQAAFGRLGDATEFTAFIREVAQPAVESMMTLGHHVIAEHMRAVLRSTSEHADPMQRPGDGDAHSESTIPGLTAELAAKGTGALLSR